MKTNDKTELQRVERGLTQLGKEFQALTPTVEEAARAFNQFFSSTLFNAELMRRKKRFGRS